MFDKKKSDLASTLKRLKLEDMLNLSTELMRLNGEMITLGDHFFNNNLISNARVVEDESPSKNLKVTFEIPPRGKSFLENNNFIDKSILYSEFSGIIIYKNKIVGEYLRAEIFNPLNLLDYYVDEMIDDFEHIHSSLQLDIDIRKYSIDPERMDLLREEPDYAAESMTVFKELKLNLEFLHIIQKGSGAYLFHIQNYVQGLFSKKMFKRLKHFEKIFSFKNKYLLDENGERSSLYDFVLSHGDYDCAGSVFSESVDFKKQGSNEFFCEPSHIDDNIAPLLSFKSKKPIGFAFYTNVDNPFPRYSRTSLLMKRPEEAVHEIQSKIEFHRPSKGRLKSKTYLQFVLLSPEYASLIETVEPS